jgi:TPR repeat protein
VLKDYKQAVYWYQKAADQGYAEAQSILGVMYANGKGVLKDLAIYQYFHILRVNIWGHVVP